MERRGFEKKKAALEQRGARYARRLLGFAYAAFHAILAARAYDAGVALRSVTPAYTSVIGAYKFARRYGLSVHQAAACSIGRRGMRLAERPTAAWATTSPSFYPRGIEGSTCGRSGGRSRGGQRRIERADGPATMARSSSAPTPRTAWGTARRAIRSSAAGERPAREPSAASFG